MKEKAIFLDFDGTICPDRYWRSLPPELHEKIQALLFSEDRTMVSDWMRGGYTAEEINHFAAKQLNMPYEELWKLFVRDCKTMQVPEEIFTELANLRQAHTLVLMTGNMDSFHRFTVPALNLEKHFDYISNSYYERKHKTDINGQLFIDWAEKLGLPMSDITLIDDSSRCCHFFAELGGKAHQTKGPAHTIEILRSINKTTG